MSGKQFVRSDFADGDPNSAYRLRRILKHKVDKCLCDYMRISEAVYTLASIQRTSDSARSSKSAFRQQPGSGTPPAQGESLRLANDTQSPAQASAPRSLADMLHQHFVNEVRLRDRDGDGLLSLSEYASTLDEFNALDTDADGRISAFDLVRAALQRNHDLSEIVAGPWAPIYSAVLNSKSTDSVSLKEAAKTGAMEAIYQSLSFASPVTSGVEPGQVQSVPTIESLMDEFLSQHSQLDLLRSRLDDLAQRLGRTPQYRHIDQTA